MAKKYVETCENCREIECACDPRCALCGETPTRVDSKGVPVCEGCAQKLGMNLLSNAAQWAAELRELGPLAGDVDRMTRAPGFMR